MAVPYFDRAESSNTICRVGLAFCWIAGIVSLVLGVYLLKRRISLGPSDARVITVTNVVREVTVLCLNILVTVCNDICGES